MKTILFTGGGSVGHIAPGVAVWEAVQNLQPDTSAHFVCADRPDDREFLEKEGVPFTTIDAPKGNFQLLLKWWSAAAAAKKILDEIKPDLIFSKGGYVSVPICWQAKRRGIPIVLHESDAIIGRANRVMSRWATKVCLGFGNPKSQIPNPKVEITGNPVRKVVTQGSREQGLKITGFSGERPVLLVMGGSQGAQAINEAVTNLLPDLLETYDVIHITGREKSSTISGSADQRINDAYWQTEFVTDQLPHLYAISSIAISRAGAGSIAELSANGIPAIYVPLRHVPHAHQEQNALIAEEQNLGKMIYQENLKTELLHSLEKIQDTNPKIQDTNAAEMIAKVILN